MNLPRHRVFRKVMLFLSPSQRKVGASCPSPGMVFFAVLLASNISAQGQQYYAVSPSSGDLQYAAVPGFEAKNASCPQDNWPKTTSSGFYTFDVVGDNHLGPFYVDQNGSWLAASGSFHSVPSMSSVGGSGSEVSLLSYLLIREQGSSNFSWSLAPDGLLTISEAGSDNTPNAVGQNVSATFQTMHLTWSGRITLNLNTGSYNWQFQSQVNGLYAAYPFYGYAACPVSSGFIGSYNTIVPLIRSALQGIPSSGMAKPLLGLSFVNPAAASLGHVLPLPASVSALAAANAPAVSAIAADGQSAVAVVFRSASPAPVTLSLSTSQFGTDSTKIGSLTAFLPSYLSTPSPGTSTTLAIPGPINADVCTIANIGTPCVFVALLWAPSTLPTTNLSGLTNPFVLLNVQVAQNSSTQRGSILLQAPPVVLVHGVWSSASQAWSGFIPWLQGYYTNDELVSTADYGAYSHLSFTTPATQATLGHAIANALTQAAVLGVAARRVDIIGHSMGGLVTMYFVQNLQQGTPPPPFAPGFFPTDVVRKLITIGTPVLGSPLATALWSSRDSNVSPSSGSGALVNGICLAAKVLPCTASNFFGQVLGKKIDTGVKSLENGTAASLNFSAIEGRRPALTETLAGLNMVIEAFLPGQTVDGNNGLLSQPDDTIVPGSSQTAGASDTSAVAGVVHTALAPSDTGETASQAVWTQALCWLLGGSGQYDGVCTSSAPATKATAKDKELQDVSRPAATTPPQPIFDLTGYTQVPASNIQFTPATAATLTIGSASSIAAKSSTKTINEILLFQLVADSTDTAILYSTQAPFTIAFTPTRLGVVNFVAFALFTDHTYCSTTLSYPLQPSGKAAWLALIAPADNLLPGLAVQVRAQAYFANGAIDVTSAANLSARSGTNSVFSIAPDGMITATGSGADWLDANYGGLKASVEIHSGNCTYALSPLNQLVDHSGGIALVQIATQPGCAWTGSIAGSWLTSSSLNGDGVSSISLASNSNNSNATRTAQLTVGGQTVLLTQPAASCNYGLAQSQISILASGGAGTVSLTANCPVLPVASANWITAVSLGAPGSLSIGYSIAPNSDSAPRMATIGVGGVSLTVTQSGTATPLVASVSDAASYAPTFASGGLLAIFGSGLSTTTRTWQAGDFVRNALPTSLDGVQVKINGILAYVYYVSPNQLNVVAPDDPLSGPVSVQVINGQGVSNSILTTKQPFAPALFAYSQLNGRFVVAQDSLTYALIGPTGFLGDGATTQPASPGQTLSIYATGLGPTYPPYPPGQIIQAPIEVLYSPQLTVGKVPATVLYAGMVSAGLYQINFVVPVLPPGDAPISISQLGLQSSANVFIPIR